MERISSFLTRGFSKKGKTPQTQTHTVHLSSHPAYPQRAPVKYVLWDIEDPTYNPVDFTHPAVIENDRSKKKNGWADPMEWTPELEKEVASRISNSIEPGGKIKMVNGKPRNPIGRTGMIGRGLLGKYGPNYAADPLVTRYDPETGNLQMVVIQRKDNGQWAIPGGMVDEGEKVSVTLKREFFEEAQNLKEEDQKETIEKLEELFDKGGKTVYIGYVDDPRNTDNSWMETMCVHFHIDDPFLSANMKLSAGDDAAKARWLDISDEESDFKNLYASHRNMVIQGLIQEPTKYATTLRKVHL